MLRVCEILLIGLVAVAGMVRAAEPIAVDSLQYRLDRLYFPIGEEEGIYRNATFTIMQGDSAIYHSFIEHSWYGTAASFPTGHFFDTIRLADLQAELVPAEVDSGAPFTVGFEPALARLFTDTLGSEKMHAESYGDPAMMWEDLAAGQLDGAVSLHDNRPSGNDGPVISSPWPFVVALVPNLRRACNAEGKLTTSLFYRFDPGRLDLVWDGDALPVYESGPPALHRLWSQPPYAYSPATGRTLLTLVKNLPPVVKLYHDGPMLRTAAWFFGDILAQDHIRVEFVERRADADVYIEFVPVSVILPALSVHDLRYELSRDTLAGSAPAETVAQIGHTLDYLANMTSVDEYFRTIQQAERRLSEDLGVFPLFYPMYYFHARPNLRGVTFNPNGRLDFSHAYRLVLPPETPR